MDGQESHHIRLTTMEHGKHHITIPKHKYLKIGTLSNILNDIANHIKISKMELLQKLLDNR